VTYDWNAGTSTGTAKIYIDGIVKGTGTGTNTGITSYGLYIGGPEGSAGFNGLIDEVTYYNRALSQAEIQQNMAAINDAPQLPPQPPSLEDSLISHWKMNEGSGNIAADSVGSNHGILANYIEGDLPAWSTDVPGPVSGYSINFNNPTSGGQVIMNATPTGIDINQKTVGMWVKAIGAQNSQIYLITNTDFAGHGWFLSLNNGTTWEYGHWGVGVVDVPATNINNWHYVMATKDATTMKLYIDGAFAGSAAFSGYNASAGPLVIGMAGANPVLGLNGLIDEVTIYNRALTAAEALQTYQATLSDCPVSDFTGDCYVDFQDFAALAADWLVCGSPSGCTP
ncbi:MAG: LamG-like jellyroll fold domain-containing protein, partial [Phycisphaerae bacterium]